MLLIDSEKDCRFGPEIWLSPLKHGNQTLDWEWDEQSTLHSLLKGNSSPPVLQVLCLISWISSITNQCSFDLLQGLSYYHYMFFVFCFKIASLKCQTLEHLRDKCLVSLIECIAPATDHMYISTLFWEPRATVPLLKALLQSFADVFSFSHGELYFFLEIDTLDGKSYPRTSICKKHVVFLGDYFLLQFHIMFHFRMDMQKVYFLINICYNACTDIISHRMHGTGVFTYIWVIFMVNVGKYTSPKDAMGTKIYIYNIHLYIYIYSCTKTASFRSHSLKRGR